MTRNPTRPASTSSSDEFASPSPEPFALRPYRAVAVVACAAVLALFWLLFALDAMLPNPGPRSAVVRKLTGSGFVNVAAPGGTVARNLPDRKAGAPELLPGSAWLNTALLVAAGLQALMLLIGALAPRSRLGLMWAAAAMPLFCLAVGTVGAYMAGAIDSHAGMQTALMATAAALLGLSTGAAAVAMALLPDMRGMGRLAASGGVMMAAAGVVVVVSGPGGPAGRLDALLRLGPLAVLGAALLAVAAMLVQVGWGNATRPPRTRRVGVAVALLIGGGLLASIVALASTPGTVRWPTHAFWWTCLANPYTSTIDSGMPMAHHVAQTTLLLIGLAATFWLGLADWIVRGASMLAARRSGAERFRADVLEGDPSTRPPSGPPMRGSGGASDRVKGEDDGPDLPRTIVVVEPPDE